jgi:hypothetical protein
MVEGIQQQSGLIIVVVAVVVVVVVVVGSLHHFLNGSLSWHTQKAYYMDKAFVHTHAQTVIFIISVPAFFSFSLAPPLNNALHTN